ncbi:TPA: type II toxin-antitoxin system PemK/MazF family toxin [bacterium]|nr:type II toxin-antitoxin system PemK/MazF family toxin [bacterium]
MKSYNFGDIVLLLFPFADTSESKKRPALILLDSGDDDILVARITSQLYQTFYDVEIISWREVGLLVPSVVRLHKLATLGKRLVDQKLGTLADKDFENIKAKIRDICFSI